MKPFNLERALAGDPVVARNGKPVTQLTLFTNTKTDPLVGVVDEVTKAWKTNGKYYYDDQECPYDLFMGAVKYTGWLVLYEPNYCGERVTSPMYPSREALLQSYSPDMPGQTIVKVEWEE